MHALREPDAFPATDVTLLRSVSCPQTKVTPGELVARAEAWRPWRAYARSTSGPTTLRSSLRQRTNTVKLWLERVPGPVGTILLVSDGESLRALDFEDYEPRMHQLLRRYCGESKRRTPRHSPNSSKLTLTAILRLSVKFPSAQTGQHFSASSGARFARSCRAVRPRMEGWPRGFASPRQCAPWAPRTALIRSPSSCRVTA